LSALLLIDIPWFLIEGKDLQLCLSYFPLRVSQLPGYINNQLHASHQALFWRRCRGEWKTSAWRVFRTHILYFVICFALLYFIFTFIILYQKHKKK
jgi:hypothetical protein